MFQQPMILIVEDEDSIRETMKELLESEAYLIQTAENGEEALKCLKNLERLPDLVMLDLMMPVMNGRDFLQKAGQVHPDFKKVPICILTADMRADTSDLKGRIAHLKKPVELEEMNDVIERLIWPH